MLGSRAAAITRSARRAFSSGSLHPSGIDFSHVATPTVASACVYVRRGRLAPSKKEEKATLPPVPPSSSPASAPSPYPSNITFVNFKGERRQVSGRVGETLLDVAARHRYDFVLGACRGGGSPVEKLHKEGEWVEPKFGQGASCYFCHVVVGKEHAAALPRMAWDEKEELDKYPLREDITETCVRVARVFSRAWAALVFGRHPRLPATPRRGRARPRASPRPARAPLTPSFSASLFIAARALLARCPSQMPWRACSSTCPTAPPCATFEGAPPPPHPLPPP